MQRNADLGHLGNIDNEGIDLPNFSPSVFNSDMCNNTNVDGVMDDADLLSVTLTLSVVNYHKIWKGMESERKMGRVDLGIGKKDGEKGFRNWEENWGEILFGELMTTAQVGECQIMYFVRCLSIIIHGNEMF